MGYALFNYKTSCFIPAVTPVFVLSLSSLDFVTAIIACINRTGPGPRRCRTIDEPYGPHRFPELDLRGRDDSDATSAFWSMKFLTSFGGRRHRVSTYSAL